MDIWKWITLGFILISFPARAYALFDTVWNYVSQYQVGLEYSQSFDRVNLTYQTPVAATVPESCQAGEVDPTKQICSLSLEAGQSSGWGIFLQQAFQRQGDFYLDLDISFTARYLSGGLTKEESEELKDLGRPIYEASFDLASFIALPYVRIGYTPMSGFPDLFLSIGPSFQAAFGKVSMNEQARNVAVALASRAIGYVEFEIVFLRFGEGAFSLYASQDNAGDEGTAFYPDVLDDISDIKASFQRGTGGNFFGFGAKLLLNWP